MDRVLAERLDARRRLLAEVRALIAECAPSIAPEDIDPDAPLFGTGLAFDSIAALELVARAERRFAVRFPEERLTLAMRTPNTLADKIEALRGA